ncbi:plastid ribosomal protein S5, partial [Monoraphidium neglectum]
MALSRAAGAASGQRTALRSRHGVRPFSGSRVGPGRVVARAAEEDEAAAEAPQPAVEAESFSFNYSEARRGNSYEASDVQAALDYYSGGAGDMPYEADFAVNRFGTEDAAFFDDIDNNEGYAASEYLSVGIEEAAPKTKQRGARDEDEAFEEAVEEFDQERAASAAFEGVEVLDEDLLDDVDAADAPWSWDAGATAAAPTAAAGAAGDAEEDSILAQLATIDFEALKDEDVEQRELASMVVDALGDDLDLVALADSEGEVAAGQELSQAEEAQVDEVLALDAAEPTPELDPAVAAALAELEGEEQAAADAPLPAADVEAYLAALRAIDPATAGGSAAALGEDVRKEAVIVPEGEAAPLPDLSYPELPADVLASDASLFQSALAAGDDAETDAVLAAFSAELAELEAIQVADYNNPLGSAAMFPEEADLETYESILDATAEYMAATGDETTGELFEDGADDDAAINPYDDLDASLVARGPLVELEEDDSNFQ